MGNKELVKYLFYYYILDAIAIGVNYLLLYNGLKTIPIVNNTIDYNSSQFVKMRVYLFSLDTIFILAGAVIFFAFFYSKQLEQSNYRNYFIFIPVVNLFTLYGIVALTTSLLIFNVIIGSIVAMSAFFGMFLFIFRIGYVKSKTSKKERENEVVATTNSNYELVESSSSSLNQETLFEQDQPIFRTPMFQCLNCHNLIAKSSTFCPDCGYKVERCPICNGPFNNLDQLIQCPYCLESFHKTHLLEAIKIHGSCPQCSHELKDYDVLN